MVTPHPAPELQKLDYFVGTWLLDGEMKSGPMGSGGKVTETDINQWMDGGFFLVVRSEFTIAGVSGTGVAYMGFDPNDKTYTYDEFNSMGDAIHSKGTVEGDRWIWTGDRKTESGVAKTRWVVNILSTTSYDFKFETSANVDEWNTVMAGRATKQ